MKKHFFGSLLFLMFFLAGCSPEEQELDLDSHKLTLGLSAQSYLSDAEFTSLTIEILYVEGFEPSASAVEAMKSFLQKYLHKPGGIRIIKQSIPPQEIGTYSMEEVRKIEDVYRTAFSSGSDLATFIFIADDRSVTSTDTEKKLGTAYRNTSMVIYGQDVVNTSVDFKIARDQVLHTVIRHEFGHLLGLVNNGSDSQADHEAAGQRAHCSTDGCLMEAKLNFLSPNSLELDALCKRDLVANGGKV